MKGIYFVNNMVFMCESQYASVKQQPSNEEIMKHRIAYGMFRTYGEMNCLYSLCSVHQFYTLTILSGFPRSYLSDSSVFAPPAEREPLPTATAHGTVDRTRHRWPHAAPLTAQGTAVSRTMQSHWLPVDCPVVCSLENLQGNSIRKCVGQKPLVIIIVARWYL